MSDTEHLWQRDAEAHLARTGGPAFPRPGLPPESQTGMTLRDYFAAKAMAVFLAKVPLDESGGMSAADWAPIITNLAGGAYEMADAMLKARAT